jgi:hypothetical protein
MTIAKMAVAPIALAVAALLVGAASTAKADVLFSCRFSAGGYCNVVALPGCISCAL